MAQPAISLAVTALVRFTLGIAAVLALLLLPAGTAAYWQAWVYSAVLFIPMLLALTWLLRHDPALLERRMRTKEKEAEQGLIRTLGAISYLLVFVLAGLDRRFGWSQVWAGVVTVADLLVLLGYALFVRVLQENSYASRVIEVEAGQRVISTGPYRIVRHPMYLAILVMFGATPVALGSWWAVIPSLPLVAVLVARIRVEERLLGDRLEGYREYSQHTRHRLLPGVW